MSDEQLKALADRLTDLLNQVDTYGAMAAMQHQGEIKTGARQLLTETYRRLGEG